MKIAVVGTGTSANDAPIGEEGWKIWSLPGNYDRWKDIDKADEWFELHEIPYLLNDCNAKPEFMELLAKMGNKLSIMGTYAGLPKAKAFPRQQLIDTFGAYFTSSIAWIIALAVLNKPETIGIWGINCSGRNEYAEQRACIEGYLRYAQALGINLQIHTDSMLFKGFLYHDAMSQRVTKKLREIEKQQEYEQDMANYKKGYVDGLKFVKLGLGE